MTLTVYHGKLHLYRIRFKSEIHEKEKGCIRLEYKEIGERIKKERKRLGIRSQLDLMELLRDRGCPVGRNSVSGLETGKAETYQHINLGLLSNLCDLYGCDLGYLLGLYPQHSREASVACEITGLSEQAVENIRSIKDWNNREMEAFSMFCASDPFFDFVNALSNCYSVAQRIADLRAAQDMTISADPQTETYRKSVNTVLLRGQEKQGRESAEFKLNQVAVRLADFMISKSFERWGDDGEKKQS